ncbi:hypothetical protein LINGRAHAP2_LOCUS22196 [Linum grandiflorum]
MASTAVDGGRMVPLSQDIADKMIALEYSNTFPELPTLAGVNSSAVIDRKFLQSFPGLFISGGPQNHPYEFVPFSSVSSMLDLNKKNSDSPVPPPTLRWSPPPTSKTPFARCQCVASKDGWLVLTQPTSTGRPGFLVHVFNPITGDAVALPPLSNFAAKDICKVILSCSPEDEECCVFILFQSAPQLAWCKPGGNWVFPASANLLFESLEDAAYSSGKLYVVDNHHGHRRYVHILDNPTAPAATISSIEFSPVMMSSHSVGSTKFRHVAFDLDGQLLILIRHLEREIVTFRVYRLLDTTSSTNWEEVKSFDGYVLFLGQHESFCRPVGDDDSTIRPNSIYFAFYGPKYYQNDAFWRWHVNDCGIFTLDQKFERFSPTQQRSQLFFWFLPMALRTNVEKLVRPASQATAEEVDDIDDEDEHDENGEVDGHNKFGALLLLDENEDDDSDE